MSSREAPGEIEAHHDQHCNDKGNHKRPLDEKDVVPNRIEHKGSEEEKENKKASFDQVAYPSLIQARRKMGVNHLPY